MVQFIKVLSSNKLTLLLLFLFGFFCAWGTFLENDYGTPAAKAFIYEAWWFELIMGLLAVNFLLNIKKYALYKKEKWTVLLFHIGFVVILIGAFVSRYTGFEGMIDIREGHQKDYLLSQETYLTATTNNQSKFVQVKPTALTVPHVWLNFNDGNQIEVTATDFVAHAEEVIEKGDEHLLQVVVAEENNRNQYYLKSGSVIKTMHGTLGFNALEPVDVALKIVGDSITIVAENPMEFMVMSTQQAGACTPGVPSKLQLRTLYQSGSLNFVVKESYPNAKLVYRFCADRKKRQNLPGKLFLNVRVGDKSQRVVLDFFNGETVTKTVKVNNQNVVLSMGPKKIPLGFAIYLKDFELIRYPGSTSPSSYSSYVEVRDGEEHFPYHIYMNNVLDYKGFRFFQASYSNDELGTVLSVNHDWWGTIITYLGYLFLGLGMIWSLFDKHSRFTYINKRLAAVKAKKMALAFLLILAGPWVFASEIDTTNQQVKKLARIYPAPVLEHFGQLLVQDMDGRIKPINTLAEELTRKITGGTTFNLQYDQQKVKLNANQFFLAVHANPPFWAMAPVIKIDEEEGKQIFEQLHIEAKPYIALRNFFDAEGNYLLQQMVDEAYNTKPDQRNKHLEQVIKVDERFNILYQALTDSYIKVFPRPNDKNHKWFAGTNTIIGFNNEDSNFVKSVFPLIFLVADSTFSTGEWQHVEVLFDYIGTFQQRYASEILPSPSRVNGELLYNKLKLFIHLFYSYWAIGFLLLVVAIAKLFSTKKWLHTAGKLGVGLVAILFLAHTFNVLLRWYAANYPPWSNGYEMIILVSWVTVLFGLIFQRKTNFILPLAALFSGTLLFVAFLDWLNPEITNLVPVLKSYWLKIHVAIIVGSYAPLALCALLGFTSLWLMIAVKNPSKKLKLALTEITLLNEISMTIGIYMLAIGTFLGGVWANESWGRYWGWDPKETWALISILVYAIVLHLRLIPQLKNNYYWFNAASVVAFFSIIMTSFGVNYYLSGLHSYAQGDPVPIPVWVYYLVAVILGTLALAWFKNKQQKVS